MAQSFSFEEAQKPLEPQTFSFEEAQKPLELKTFSFEEATAKPKEEAPTEEPPKEAKPATPVVAPTEGGFRPVEQFIEKGIPTGVIGLKSMKAGVDLITDANAIGAAGKSIETYDAIDAGQVSSPAQAQQMGLSPQAAQAYLRASPEAREQIRKNQQEIILKRQDLIKEGLNLFKQYQAEAEKVRGVTPDLTDVNTMTDFGNWLSFNAGSGAVTLLPVMAAAITTGGWGTLALSTAMGTGEAVNNRLEFIQNKVKDLPAEQQANEIENYIRNTTDTSMAVGLATGVLDMAGPVGSILRARAGKEGVKYLTKKEAATAAVKEAPRAIGEEFLTGGAQEIVQIGGERVLGEQTGDLLSTENIKRVINAAAAEAAGGTIGAGINVPLNVLKTAQEQAAVRGEEQAYKDAMSDILREKGFVFTREDPQGTTEEKYVNDLLGGDLNDGTTEGNRLLSLVDDFKAKVSELFGKTETEATEIEAKPENLDKLVANYEAQGMNRDAAVMLANQAIKEAGYDDRTVSGGGKSSVSVSNEPIETLAGVNAAERRDVAGASKTVDAVGSGEGTQLGTLTPLKKAKVETPTANGVPITKGKAGRKKIEVTPEVAAEKAAIKKQQAAAAVSATREVPKLQKVLQETFDPSAYADIEEAAPALEAFNERQRQAAEDLYRISTGPQRNNTAGKRATEVLATLPTQMVDLAKARVETKKKAQATIAKSTVASVDESVLKDSTNGQDNRQYIEWPTAQAALKWVMRKGNPFEKLLAKRLLPFLKGVKIVVVDDELVQQYPAAYGTVGNFIATSDMPVDHRNRFRGAAGMYYEDGNEKIIYLAGKGGINNTVFLHEALHGATLMRIKNFLRARKKGIKVDPSLEDAVGDLIDVMRRSKEFYAALTAAVDRGLITDPAQLRLVKIAGVFNKSGAFDDPAEFVAYGMTHPSFQEFLRVVPGKVMGEKTTVMRIKDGLTQFVQAIRKMFGMGEGDSSALQDLIIVSDKVLRAKPIDQDLNAGLPESARAKKEKVDRTIQKIQRGEQADDINGLLGELIKARSWSDAKDLFKASFSTLSSKSIQALMPVLTSMQIIDWVSDQIPQLQEVSRLTEKMAVMRSKMLAKVDELTQPWLDFNKKFIKGARDLSRLMHYTTLEEVDPTLHKTVAEAIKNDPILAELNNKLAQAAVTSKPAIKGQITRRTNAIKRAYLIWDRVGSYGKGQGQKIYTDIKQHYKNIFDLHRAILNERIANLKIEGDINDASTPKGKLMSAIRASYEGAKQIPVYFPLSRDGQYWVRFGTGVNREFYMFESEFVRNYFIANRLKQLRKEGDTRDEDTMRADGDLDSGNDLTKLRQASSENSEILTRIFEIIDTTGVQDKDALKDSVYQMYLLTMPEQSFRSQFVHRKGTAGFTGDALRNFAKLGYKTASQLSTLKYGPEIFNALDTADESLKGNPDKERLEIFTRELRNRVIDEVNPDIEDQWMQRFANGINQTAFIMFLTAPASALANLTAVPIFGYWVLASRYGAAKAAKMLASYSKVWNHTTLAKYDSANTRVGWTPISIGFSKHVRNNPVLQAAFTEAAERGISEITRTYDLLALAKTPSTKFTGRVSRFYRGSINAMGALFHHSERLNRELMFMSSFELAYEKAVSEGLAAGVNGPAFQRAVDESVRNTYDSMFNYTKFNRPRLFKGPVGRVVFQFKMFPQQVTGYFVRNYVTMHKGLLAAARNIPNPTERARAIQDVKEGATQFFGTLLMTGLFAGTSGMLLYSAIIGVIQGIRDAMQDEDDPIPFEERDIDYWFRYVVLPKYFGDELAKIIQKGPISVFSNTDIGARTSLNNLWFRDTQDDKSLLTDVRNQVIGFLGPSVGLVENWIKAYEDWKNGYTSQAVEKILPALFKGMVAQSRWADEGIVSKTQKAELYNKDEVTTAMRFWKAFGLNPTELAIQQEKNFKVIEDIRKTNEEYSDIIKQVKQAGLDGNFTKLDKQIERFVNFAISNPDLEPDVDSIITAIENAEKARAEAINGVVVTNEKLRARAAMLLGNLPKK